MQIDTKNIENLIMTMVLKKKFWKEIESKKHFPFLFTWELGKHILAWNHC
jgi:hypothetical protein